MSKIIYILMYISLEILLNNNYEKRRYQAEYLKTNFADLLLNWFGK